ncbi:hypothetical protein ACLBXO_26695 [Methylobacterium sp. C33D]
MNAMLLGLVPLLIILTWSAGYVLVERAWRQRGPGHHIVAAILCAGFSLAAIAVLAWAVPQPGQNWSDAPLGRLVPDDRPALHEPAAGRW